MSVFLFSDIEGSTRLWAAHPDVMGASLERHDAVLMTAVEAAGGTVFKHTGDGIVARFDSAGAAVGAAVDAQRGLAAQAWGPVGPLRVRIGIHAGDAQKRGGDWFGQVLNRTARLMGVAHGGQVVVSAAVEALARDAVPADVALVDLGVHRLRDLAEPEHVWQVAAPGLTDAFPPLHSLDGAATNLPSELSSFLGRDAEVADVAEVLAHHRLVTLTGVGGVGKTRLALQAAAEVLPLFADGVWVCELAAVADPAVVDDAVLAALGFVVRPGATPRTALVEALTPRELLVVLDNCEHLRHAVAELVDAVLRAAPRARVLATSREPLGVMGERGWSVEPLAVEGAAVDLFVERAAAVRRGFAVTPENRAVISEICRHLDGVPLAIELAAARTRSITLDDLRERLGERFRILSSGRSSHTSGRHATLRATLDWSYELLAADEQALFDRLSIFAGRFNLPGAVSVAAELDADDLDVLDVLTALVDKSMVQQLDTRGVTRYRLLETMRHYGAEHIAAAGVPDELSSRHAAYYADFVERAAEGLRGPDEVVWAQAFDADFDNVRIAVRWALEHGDTDLALRLISPPWTYVIDRLDHEPGQWAEEALCLPNVQRHPLAALTHVVAGFGAAGAGRYDDALRHGQAAITLAEKGAPQHLWPALHVAWAGAFALGQEDLLQSFTERLVDSARAAKDDYAVSRTIWTQVLVHRSVPLGIDVRAAAAECLELAQRVGNPTLLARAHAVVGIVQCPDNPAAAGEHFAACEQFARLVNARMFIVYGVLWGAVAASMQNPDAGLRELARALDFHQATATPLGATRIALRDMLPALAAVGLHRLVVMLDAHLPTVAIIQPDRDAAAVQSARRALGAAETDQAQAQAQAIDFDKLLSLLRQELETVLGTRTALPEQRSQPPITD